MYVNMIDMYMFFAMRKMYEWQYEKLNTESFKYTKN